MPRKPIDYSKSVIYKIQHITDESLVYIGSTTEFTKRKNYHKYACYNENKKYYHYKIYQMIRENGNWNSFTMIPIKEFPCQSSIQLKIEEEKFRLELNANLNMIRAYSTKEENQQQKKEHSQKTYIENKQQILEKQKEKFTCDCGSTCRVCDKARHEKSQKHLKYICNI